MQASTERIKLIHEFNEAPVDALFPQKTVAALRHCSNATLERDRWAGTGIPFIKIGRQVRYNKRDILEFFSKHKLMHSTSDTSCADV